MEGTGLARKMEAANLDLDENEGKEPRSLDETFTIIDNLETIDKKIAGDFYSELMNLKMTGGLEKKDEAEFNKKLRKLTEIIASE